MKTDWGHKLTEKQKERTEEAHPQGVYHQLSTPLHYVFDTLTLV